jgi:hypothetical protein
MGLDQSGVFFQAVILSNPESERAQKGTDDKVTGLRSQSLSEALLLSMDSVPIRPFDSDTDSDTDSEPAGSAFHKSTGFPMSMKARQGPFGPSNRETTPASGIED